MNIEKLIIHLFPIISVEAGNKAQSLNITLSLQGEKEMREWGEYRKWIILLLFYFFTTAVPFVRFSSAGKFLVCMSAYMIWSGVIFFSQGAIDFLLFSFSLHIIPFIDYHFLWVVFYLFFNKSSRSHSHFLSRKMC